MSLLRRFPLSTVVLFFIFLSAPFLFSVPLKFYMHLLVFAFCSASSFLLAKIKGWRCGSSRENHAILAQANQEVRREGTRETGLQRSEWLNFKISLRSSLK
jgi:hypothetical protein